MTNERLTENIVREHFRNDSMFTSVQFEEQISSKPIIDKLLQNASKRGVGKGYPDFLITAKSEPKLVIIIECKADVSRHESKTRRNYEAYAVDGVLLYSDYVSEQFNVLSLAVSGIEKDAIKVSYFIQRVGEEAERIFGNKLISLEDIFAGVNQDKIKRSQQYEDLLLYSRDLNNLLHELKIKEDKRSLLVSGILIALKNRDFYRDYPAISSNGILAQTLVSTIQKQLENEALEDKKIANLMENYSFLQTHPSLVNPKDSSKVLKNLLDDIDEKINGYVRTYKYFDILGQFYIEFLRYSNADKGLGIVLTPPHIADLFCDLINIRSDDIVYDNCTGTAGFLVSSMKKMIEQCQGVKEQENKVKNCQLFGVEYQPEIYPLAVSNMFLHGDGKSNILNDNCFDGDVIARIKSKKPTVAFLNPPYKSDKKKDQEELNFILNALSCLEKHGRCVAIVPMSCMLAEKGKRINLKEQILKNHTLEAVFSMPDELFFNSKVGVVSAVIVIKAKVPHATNHYTFLGYLKNDGFTKRKEKGRFDYRKKWESIKNYWLDIYNKKETIAGMSVIKKISAIEEWCAEAYMETDYHFLTSTYFEKTLLDYSSYLFSNQKILQAKSDSLCANVSNLSTGSWGIFCLGDLFDITGSKTTPPLEFEDIPGGKYPYVTTSAINNGVKGFYNKFTESGECITVDSAINGYASYQKDSFTASDHVEKLILRNYKLNPYVAMFLVTILNNERYRYNYGRKPSQSRLKISSIRLPVKNENEPNWQFMESYIKSLPYSSNLKILEG